MIDDTSVNGHGPTNDVQSDSASSFRVKAGLAQMLKGGVIMDVVNAEQAMIAEGAGACAVMALERVPADIRAQGGVARMSDPKLIKEIMEAVTIPVMAKARIGHFVECQACTVPACSLRFCLLTPEYCRFLKHSVWTTLTSLKCSLRLTQFTMLRSTPSESPLSVVAGTSARHSGASLKVQQ